MSVRALVSSRWRGAPAGARRRARTPPPPTRVLVVGLDGATWDVARPLLAAGELPHLAALIARGVDGDAGRRRPRSSRRSSGRRLHRRAAGAARRRRTGRSPARAIARCPRSGRGSTPPAKSGGAGERTRDLEGGAARARRRRRRRRDGARLRRRRGRRRVRRPRATRAAAALRQARRTCCGWWRRRSRSASGRTGSTSRSPTSSRACSRVKRIDAAHVCAVAAVSRRPRRRGDVATRGRGRARHATSACRTSAKGRHGAPTADEVPAIFAEHLAPDDRGAARGGAPPPQDEARGTSSSRSIRSPIASSMRTGASMRRAAGPTLDPERIARHHERVRNAYRDADRAPRRVRARTRCRALDRRRLGARIRCGGTRSRRRPPPDARGDHAARRRARRLRARARRATLARSRSSTSRRRSRASSVFRATAWPAGRSPRSRGDAHPSCR